MKIGVVSLGCVKNRVDTEQMLSLLTQAGHEFTTDPAQAEVLLVNTCGFIDPAKEESIQTILEMAQYKRTGRCKKLIVTGCLAQRYGDALLSDMPEIDALLGVNQYAQIVQAVEEVSSGSKKRGGKAVKEKDAAKPKRQSKPRKKVVETNAAGTSQIQSIEGQTCPLCGKGTIIKGKTAYGCSEWKNGCTFRKPFE